MDAVFGALADPTRLAMVSRLAVGDATVNQLARPFGLSQPTITRHIQVLEGAGLVSRRREGRSRPVHLEERQLAVAADWIEQQRRLWAHSLARLDAITSTNEEEKEHV